MKWPILLITVLGCCSASAQTDQWTGIWKMTWKRVGYTDINFQLHIGKAEQGVLYPAVITITQGKFTGMYELMLARKNETQLGIGRGKYPIQQTPFSLGIWLWYFNGNLEMKNNSIKLNRMFIDKADFWMRGLYDEDEIWVHSKVMLRDFLYREAITLTKTGNRSLPDSSIQRILHPEISKIYLGKYDKQESKNSTITIRLGDNEKYDKDTVTLLQNGRAIFTREQINDNNRTQELKLDTGRNLLVLFADNYGNLQPNTGSLRATIDSQDHEFSFSNRSNAYATFLVADIYHSPSKKVPVADTPSTRSTTSIAMLTINTTDIVLELRDTEIQDGDSISLRVNGKWIARGFPVKKAVQEIPVKLKKGENRLLFVADNLGSIPPNTAELRIRYGSQTKTLTLSTDLARDNEIILMVE